LLFIPVLFFVVLFSFILLHYSPGNPVESMLGEQNAEQSFDVDQKIKDDLTGKLGFDLPVFYISILSLKEKQEITSDSRKDFIPAVTFHPDNQFHRWLFGSNENPGIIHGDLGRSWITGQRVSSIIGPRLLWSVLLTFFSVLLAYLISIPAGIKAATKPELISVKFSNKIFIILHSLPSFWIATLLMFLLCNPTMFNILPSSGVGPIGGFEAGTGFLQRVFYSLPYLILPTICYTYSSLAFLSNNVRVSIVSVMKQDFIRTARAKGLSEKTVIWRHALRNALLPMITIFSGVFPLAIGGAVILETVFSIPGMGLMIYQSILTQDYPVVISVFMITAIVTVITFLLSDILYAIADPRISYSLNR
jgi:peptide/nickel transport system permease protein